MVLPSRLLFLLPLFILVLILLNPTKTYACGSYTDPRGVTCGGPTACNPNIYEGTVHFRQPDGSTCDEVRYYSDSACGSETSNPCPRGCTSDSECGAGFCAGGLSDFCTNPRTGRWCVGYICGWDCDSPGSASCHHRSPGSGVSSFGTQASCEADSSCQPTRYGCAGGQCVQTPGGFTTDPTCGGICAAHYRCNGSSCVSDPTGPFTNDPTCGGTCTTRYRCDTSTFSCVQDPVGSFTDFNSCTANCTEPTCSYNCGSYTDTWTCSGGAAMTCTTFSTSAATCGTPCRTQCSGCPGPQPTPTSSPSGGCSGFFCSGDQCRQRLPGCDSIPAPNSSCNNGNGCGGCQRTVGEGAGCDPGAGTCCQSGLSCDNGTCKKKTKPPPCDPLGWVTGTPVNGTTNLPSNVTLSWQTNEDPNRGACSGSGRQFELWWGSCPTSTYIDPSQITNPNHCTQEGYTNGRTQNFTCGVAPGAGFPEGYNLTQTLTGLSGGWHYWRVENNCSCHWCDVGAPPVFTCVSGSPQVPGCPTGQTPGAWMFQVNGPPNAPILACQTITPGDPYPDICDASVGSPTGYGNISRGNLTARDGGPTSARQPFFTHRYFITDQTSGVSLPTIIGPNNGSGALFSIDARPYLTNGHRYSWHVVTTDNASPPIPTPDSLPSATWNFLYDTTPPSATFNNPNACFDTTAGLALPPTLPIGVVDPIPPPGPPNQASNVRSVVVTVQNQTNGTTPVNNQDIFPVGSPYGNCTWPSGTPGAGNGTCNLNTAPWATPSPTGNVYLITVTSTDNAGNSATRTSRFIYRTTCIGPWLQTTQGDVHSNTRLNTPGGPP